MRKLNATLLLGIVAAVLGFGVVLTYGRTVEKHIADGREMTRVLVASTDLVTGTPAASLKQGSSYAISEVPKAYVPQDVLDGLDSVKDLVLLGPVPQGTQLSRRLFGTTSTAAAVTPSAHGVALAVEVGLSPGVARYLSVGSVVDVFVTYTTSGSTPSGEAGGNASSESTGRTKLFLSGAKVLAVSVADRAKADGKEGSEAGATASTSGVIVVLDLSPQDAERVVNAVSIGQLYLGLSSQDAHHTTPTGVTPDDVVSANR
jgi:Flp pilus assembly protein CpaB